MTVLTESSQECQRRKVKVCNDGDFVTGPELISCPSCSVPGMTFVSIAVSEARHVSIHAEHEEEDDRRRTKQARAAGMMGN